MDYWLIFQENWFEKGRVRYLLFRSFQHRINLSVNKKTERQERINKKINSVNEFINEHFGIKERSPEKVLNLFCAGLFLYTFFSGIFNARELAGYYYSTFTSWSIAILIYLIQLFIIYLLYIRSNWGLDINCCRLCNIGYTKHYDLYRIF